jgi:competence protein ComEA
MSAFKRRIDTEQEALTPAVPQLRIHREPLPGEDVPGESLPEDGVPGADVPGEPDAPSRLQTTSNRFGLKRGDQVFIAAFVVVALGLMLAYWLRLGGFGLQPVEIERQQERNASFVVDINEATWVEWAQLDGIGPALARRIVDDRNENGPFESVDDIERVPGIGPKRLAQLRPWLSMGVPRYDD